MSTYYVPSSQEFRAGAESHYSFLCQSYNFKVRGASEFSVTFCSERLCVIVEGLSYDFSLNTRIGKVIRVASEPEEVHLHTFLKLRRPELLAARYPEVRGQLEEMKFQASALQEVAGDILSGTLDEWPRLFAFEQAERLRLRNEGAAEQRRRDLDRVCSRAAEAFRSGKYHMVIKLLAPLENELSTAQRVKLRMAGRRTGDAA